MSESLSGEIAIQNVDLNADIDLLVEIDHQVFGDEAYSRHDICNFASQGWVLRKAVSDGRIIGYTMAKAEGLSYHIGNLCVIEEMQRRKVGLHLFQDMLDTAARLKCRTSLLEVKCTNAKAIRFYEKNGFKQTGVHPCYYPDGADGLVMESSLQ